MNIGILSYRIYLSYEFWTDKEHLQFQCPLVAFENGTHANRVFSNSEAAEAGVQGVQLHTHYFAPFFIKD